MSRYYSNKKDTVEDCLSIDVFWLKKYGYFCGYKYGGIKWTYRSGHESNIGFTVSTCNDYKFLRFKYTVTKDEKKEDYDYVVKIVTTRCNFNGERFWFLCPLTKGNFPCGKRVANLYLPPGRRYFGCRQCYDLSYEKRNKSKSRFSLFSKFFDYEFKSEKLLKKVKREYYNGKPTKAYKRYLQSAKEFNHTARIIVQNKHSLFS